MTAIQHALDDVTVYLFIAWCALGLLLLIGGIVKLWEKWIR